MQNNTDRKVKIGGILGNLKDFRKRQLGGMSQSEFAAKIGVCSQDAMSRLERAPGQIPLEIAMRISQVFGISYDDLLGPHVIPGSGTVDVRDTWSYARDIRARLQDYVADQNSCCSDRQRKLAENLESLLASCFEKPKIVLLGEYGAGKTTMLNALLSETAIPASAADSPDCIIHIKHVSDRPDWMNDDAYIFDPGSRNAIWDDRILEDERKSREFLRASGDIQTVTRYVKKCDSLQDADEVARAIVYRDCGILRDCDLIEVPAHSMHGAVSDEVRTADAVVYLSPAYNFMTVDKLAQLRNLTDVMTHKTLPRHEPLANLFIVASKAHLVEDDALDHLLSNAAQELGGLIEARYQKELPEIEQSLRKRFFLYSINDSDLSQHFNAQLAELIEQMPHIVADNAIGTISEWREAADSSMEYEVANILDKLQTQRNALDGYMREASAHAARRQEAADLTVREIGRCQSECLSTIHKCIAEHGRLKAKKDTFSISTKRNDREKRQLSALSADTVLEEEIKSIVLHYKKEFSDAIDKYLSTYDDDASLTPELRTLIPFHSEQRFTKALLRSGDEESIGIYGSWLSRQPRYIRAEERSLSTVFGATALGITAGTMLGIAPIGAIAAATLSGLTLLAADRRKYTEQTAADIDEMWENGKRIFKAAAARMEKNWDKSVRKLSKKLYESGGRIEQQMQDMECAKEFLSGLPLPELPVAE